MLRERRDNRRYTTSALTLQSKPDSTDNGSHRDYKTQNEPNLLAERVGRDNRFL